MNLFDRLAAWLLLLFAGDRLLKLAAVVHFFQKPRPLPPAAWPGVSLIQPITRSSHDLRHVLVARCRLRYPAAVQHLLVCDVADHGSQAICRALMAEFPNWQATLLLVEPDSGVVASKITKLQAALPHASGDVLCFVDDDVALRHDALGVLVPHLFAPQAGAAFGLACYTDWTTPWSSLISGFVQANALLSYVPLAYLAEPFTITGHCFALRRAMFQAAGGFDDMAQRIDDDHELARRVRRRGLRCVQTPLIYDVENRIASFAEYRVQFKRWFVLPRQTMAPSLTPREQAVSLLGSAGSLLPPLLGVLALFTGRRSAWQALAGSLGLFAAVYAFCERRYLGRHTPIQRWPLLLVVALVTPLHILAALCSDNQIEWRGQRLRVRRGGQFEVIS